MQKSKAPNQTMVINVQSHYKKDDLVSAYKDGSLNEINDSDLDMLLDDLKDVLDEEDISDDDVPMK